jgi:hypothetical protein
MTGPMYWRGDQAGEVGAGRGEFRGPAERLHGGTRQRRPDVVGTELRVPDRHRGQPHLHPEALRPEGLLRHTENTLFEGPSHLIDDTTGNVVGIAVTESMDVRIMNNQPGGANQH